MKRIVSTLLCIVGFTILIKAQSIEERHNRAVYNQIEYLFNTKQMDSIYNMADENFKKTISSVQLNGILNQLHSLGTIKNATPEKYQNGIAGYKIEIGNQKLLFVLGIDSNFKYHTLAFQPFEEKVIEKKEPVISKVEVQNPLDFFIDSVARTYIQKENTQSLAIGVIHRNKISTFFYGETEKNNDTLPTATTLYELGSITKTFTATLLADLVEKNIISLDDSISKFLPDSVKSNPDIQKITFKSLANHTSGLPRMALNWNTGSKFVESDPYAHYDQTELFCFLKNFKATKEVGEEYEYSNIGYGLLGELITIITKKTYAQNIEEIITKPLQMINTVEKVNSKEQQLVKVYNVKGDTVPAWNFISLAATGSLKSTIQDMLLYARSQFQMPLSPLEKAMALTKQFTFFVPPNTDIGLAWHMSMVDDIIYYNHSGGTAGSSSFIGIAPDAKSAIVVLSNSTIPVEVISEEILKKVILTK
ncbi:serine hydrolase domain-containing protein [Sphingobacterium lumbrici]|uniref:serine hydrolase domain-containing protein n=1 Tax=Sphingobacterium lumbrici TaxID=2559600 RepID=UPI00112B419E|nr:serine hydrolase domain-containing protein [Sphingobacterium lumbrici]